MVLNAIVSIAEEGFMYADKQTAIRRLVYIQRCEVSNSAVCAAGRSRLSASKRVFVACPVVAVSGSGGNEQTGNR